MRYYSPDELFDMAVRTSDFLFLEHLDRAYLSIKNKTELRFVCNLVSAFHLDLHTHDELSTRFRESMFMRVTDDTLKQHVTEAKDVSEYSLDTHDADTVSVFETTAPDDITRMRMDRRERLLSKKNRKVVSRGVKGHTNTKKKLERVCDDLYDDSYGEECGSGALNSEVDDI